jgi:hypothetical protein
MILVDTSVWVDHFRHGNDELNALLERNSVVTHTFVIGELACGTLHRRAEILALFANLPPALVVEHDEALAFLTARKLPGRGLGWIDVHLLASAIATPATLFTLDKRLADAARAVGA